MKRNAILQLLRLPAIAGIIFLWLTIPALSGSPGTSSDRDPYALQIHSIKSDAGEVFEKIIHFQGNGEYFIYASTPPEGSGAFLTEAIFWIAPDGAIHPIAFEHAGRAYENKLNEGEFLLTGGPGILFANDSLRFEFSIANEGDSHCCPTAGKISGTYKVAREKNFDPETREYRSIFKLVVDTCERDIASSEKLSDAIVETQFIGQGEDR